MRTIEFDKLNEAAWDVVVIGAGVAGSAAAILSARNGLRTLLLDAKKFPREKVCGGCLNRRAQDSLRRLGILESLERAGAVSIDVLELQIGKSKVRWSIPRILSVRRSTLDQQMVLAAINSHASFLDQASATVIPRNESLIDAPDFRQIRIRAQQGSVEISARTILVADGLTRSSLHEDKRWKSIVEPNCRVGVQRLIGLNGEEFEGRKSTLLMVVGQEGYVGFSHTDGGMFNIAAAVSPESIKKEGDISGVIRGLSRFIESPIVNLGTNEVWLATPAMTRSADLVADERVFLLGDAIGYVEPFTGEGMSWALASAESVMPLVLQNVRQGWTPQLANQWTELIRHQRDRSQATCRWIARQLRRPRLAMWVVRLCDLIGPLRSALIRKVSS